MKKWKWAVIGSLFLLFQCAASGLTEKEESQYQEMLKSPVQIAENYSWVPDSSLGSRIDLPPDFILKYVSEMDQTNYSGYRPTSGDIGLFESCAAQLPPKYQELLKQRVAKVYFIRDLMGSGMADYALDRLGKRIYILIINPAILKMNIADWLAFKERTVFVADSSGMEVRYRCGKELPALLGLMIHELTHMLDYEEGFTPFVDGGDYLYKKKNGLLRPSTAFSRGYWKEIRRPVPVFDFPGRRNITFYGLHGGPKLAWQEAPDIYRSWSLTPFASLYGSQSWAEDAAELATYFLLTEHFGMNIQVELIRNGVALWNDEPMKNPRVRKRVAVIKRWVEGTEAGIAGSRKE